MEMGAASHGALTGIGSVGMGVLLLIKGTESYLLSTIIAMKIQCPALGIAIAVMACATRRRASFLMVTGMVCGSTQIVGKIAFVATASARQPRIG